MVHPILPTVTKGLSNLELSKALDAKDNEFQVYYFKLHIYGTTPRALLAYADAKWSNIYPGDWSHDKPLTKFGSLPMMYEISADGKVIIEHAEALAIEMRLARKFNLLGDNSFEEAQILGFYSNTRALTQSHTEAYFCHGRDRAEKLESFIETQLKQWIRTHEKALVRNGGNGYYVSDRVTLAEIRTATAMEQLLNELYVFKGFEEVQRLITPELTPNLWKVRENVLQKKSYRDWVQSELFQELTIETTEYYDGEYENLSKAQM
ncbi:hypothetical protein BGZ70_009991 [Mortierella alpina]|uniref:Glutathione S-transferase C-terminal domain-containing protein n=1 Tax=Mortierella alpina TaxID=64518 RepID=A0A9P6M056_MORAP|nr:hypothetical protein BGZ70_009991 [Mortierella alpina]